MTDEQLAEVEANVRDLVIESINYRQNQAWNIEEYSVEDEYLDTGVPALIVEVRNSKTRILDLERTFKHYFVSADYHGHPLSNMCAYCGFELKDNLHFLETTND